MSTYNSAPDNDIDDIRNGVCLRSDFIQPVFDTRMFVIVPKKSSLVLHVLRTPAELMIYHNRKLHPIPGVSKEFLYARLAWAIFPGLWTFLSAAERKLMVRVADGTGAEYQEMTVF